jgi:phosphoglycerol transferase MdoB-like AlkP superfamily enzyme
MWGNPLNTTPFFDSLSRKGIFFDQCFTPTYGTARGVWAIITGIPDVEMANTASRNPAAVDQHTIINDFTGYEKYYFLGGSTSWANIRGLLTNNIKGLHLYEQEDFKAPKIDVWGISDKNLLLESAQILGGETKPFFAVIQTADNHRPYTIPEEDLKEFKKISLPNDSVKKYGFESLAEFNAFRYTDFSFQKFIQASSSQKYFDNTIFVFIGDHGIAGNAGDMFPNAWTEQRLSSFHVPFLLYAPKLFSPQRSHAICSQVDVLPTIAGACDMTYQNTALGRDILKVPPPSQFAFIFDPDNGQTGIVKGEYFFRKSALTGTEELVSLTGNENIPIENSEKAKAELRTLTDAMYETSKYMLLNNKKK